jgi:hypothetical protein
VQVSLCGVPRPFGIMHERCFTEEPTVVRDADWRGRKLRVSMWYGANTGPEDSGFGVIRDIGMDPRVKGFPVLKAEVDSSAFGYENEFGWIQWIVHLGPDGSVEDWSPDSIPALRDRGIPFVCMGYEPTFYDAPFWPDRPKLHWRADLFLCPIVVRRPSEEEIEPLVGLRWGFRIRAVGAEPEILPLEEVGLQAWAESLPRLRFWFPSWRFAERPALRPV